MSALEDLIHLPRADLAGYYKPVLSFKIDSRFDLEKSCSEDRFWNRFRKRSQNHLGLCSKMLLRVSAIVSRTADFRTTPIGFENFVGRDIPNVTRHQIANKMNCKFCEESCHIRLLRSDRRGGARSLRVVAQHSHLDQNRAGFYHIYSSPSYNVQLLFGSELP